MIQWLVMLKILLVIGPWESTAITNKRPSNEQSGNVRYFRHISNGPSSGPLADWEVGLREAINQALLREGYWEPNLRERLNSAQLIGRQDIATPFGDVAVLARGQLYAVHGGNFILLQDPYQNDCDDCHGPRSCERHDCQPYTPHNKEILIALWTVKRLRHRDIDRTRFELEYIINPVNADNDQIIMRRSRFNYAIPGHVFVIRSSENHKNYPEYYNKKIVQTNYKPEVILGVDSDGHNHVLYSYPGFITSLPPQLSSTSAPVLPSTPISTSTIKETELYKKLLEALASKTSTTQKHEEGPHRFSLNRFSDTNKVLSSTTPLTQGTTFQPITEGSRPLMPTSTAATVHYFMPTGEEILMTQAETPVTEKVTQKPTFEKSTIKPTKKYYTKTSSKPKTKFTVGATSTSRKTTKPSMSTTMPTSTTTTSTSTPTTSTSTTTTSTSTPTTSTSIPTTSTSTTTTSTITPTTSTSPPTTSTSTTTTSKPFTQPITIKTSTTTQMPTKSTKIVTPTTQKITTTSTPTKTTSFYPIYKRPKPFYPRTTKLTTSTEKVTTLKMVPTTSSGSTMITDQPITTLSMMLQTTAKIPIETTSTSTMKLEDTTTLTTTLSTTPTPTTSEIDTITEPPEIATNISESSSVLPTEPMKATTEVPLSTIQTETPLTSIPEETIGTTLIDNNPLLKLTTQIPSAFSTNIPQTTVTSESTTHRSTTASDFLTEAEPYKGPLYIGTVRNDYDLDDIFGTTKSTMKPSTSTTQKHTESDISLQLFDGNATPKSKIIFSNFYEASTASNFENTKSNKSSRDDVLLTSQSYETSVSYEVNKRNQPEYQYDSSTSTEIIDTTTTKPKPKVRGVEYKRNRSKLLHYKPKIIPTKAIVKQMPSNGTDYVIYKAEYPNDVNQTQNTKYPNVINETKTTREVFDDVALMLVNHAKSLEYLSKADNRTIRVKYRRRKTYIPRSRTTKKPIKKIKEQENR